VIRGAGGKQENRRIGDQEACPEPELSTTLAIIAIRQGGAARRAAGKAGQPCRIEDEAPDREEPSDLLIV
jgi:hypothetical protein